MQGRVAIGEQSGAYGDSSPMLHGAFEVVGLRRENAEHLDLADELEGELIVAQMKKRTFLLETRGFHWINEAPFNR